MAANPVRTNLYVSSQHTSTSQPQMSHSSHGKSHEEGKGLKDAGSTAGVGIGQQCRNGSPQHMFFLSSQRHCLPQPPSPSWREDDTAATAAQLQLMIAVCPCCLLQAYRLDSTKMRLCKSERLTIPPWRFHASEIPPLRSLIAKISAADAEPGHVYFAALQAVPLVDEPIPSRVIKSRSFRSIGTNSTMVLSANASSFALNWITGQKGDSVGYGACSNSIRRAGRAAAILLYFIWMAIK